MEGEGTGYRPSRSKINMRNSLVLVLACLLFCGPAWAKEGSPARLRAYLEQILDIEEKALTVQPMPLQHTKRTLKEDKEAARRLAFLDELLTQQCRPLQKMIGEFQAEPEVILAYQALAETGTSLERWLNAKLALQTAAVNNPSLELLRQNEPLAYKEYQVKLLAAQELLK